MKLTTYFKAIRALPSEWVHEDTRLCAFGLEVFGFNPRFPAMAFNEEINLWEQISFNLDEAVIDESVVATTEPPPIGTVIAEYKNPATPS